MRTLTAIAFLACEITWAADPTLSACLSKAGRRYSVNNKMDPYILHGDFDGDGTADSAVLVISNRQQGIVVCRSAGPPVVLGAGITFNDMKNLDFTGWRVHPRNKRVSHGVGVGRPPSLRVDALLLEWESGSGLVYWNGKKFIWYQQGD